MKTMYLAASAAALAWAAAEAHAGETQVTDQPAGVATAAPQRTVEQEIAYLRDMIAQQTLRLDETEQALKKQNAVIEAQEAKIAVLETALGAQTSRVAAAAGARTLVVKKGDTLSGVARSAQVPMSALAAANNLRAPYLITPGQRLAMPAAAGAPQLALATTAKTANAAAGGAVQQPAQATTVAQTTGPTPTERPDVTERAVQEQRRNQPEQTGAVPTEVGVRPQDAGQRPTVSVLPDVGGILTPKGALFVEPSFDYTVSADNRFFFQGTEIADAILIGSIDATSSDRRAKTANFGFRYGITSRFEIDGKIGYVDRIDRTRGVTINDTTANLSTIDGSGLSDAELGLHYQINDGRDWPYTIVNFRAKAPTGEGPFEVARNARGRETELATGSGYWTLEPSVTFILPSDPAVIFGNIGYQLNLKDRPDVFVGDTRIIEFDPGEALRASIGIGLSVNDRMSISLGYDHTNYFKTKTLVERPLNNIRVLDSLSQTPAVVGSFLFGASYRINNRLNLNLNTAIGATDDAPDVRASVRASYKLFN